MAVATDTGDFSPSGVLLAQIRKNLTLMATSSSHLPKLLVYSAVSSLSPQHANVRHGAGFLLYSVLGRGVQGSMLIGSPSSLQHDTTLVALQMALFVYNGEQAPYASCHIFELYQEDNG